MDNDEEMVSIPIDISESELAKISLAAHKHDMTINDFLVSACISAANDIIRADDEDPDTYDSSTRLFEDIYALSSLLNNVIESGMMSVELSDKEHGLLYKALKDSFSVLEIATKLNQANT